MDHVVAVPGIDLLRVPCGGLLRASHHGPRQMVSSPCWCLYRGHPQYPVASADLYRLLWALVHGLCGGGLYGSYGGTRGECGGLHQRDRACGYRVHSQESVGSCRMSGADPLADVAQRGTATGRGAGVPRVDEPVRAADAGLIDQFADLGRGTDGGGQPHPVRHLPQFRGLSRAVGAVPRALIPDAHGVLATGLDGVHAPAQAGHAAGEEV